MSELPQVQGIPPTPGMQPVDRSRISSPEPPPPPPPAVGPVANLRKLYPDLGDLSDDKLILADWRTNFPDLTEAQYFGGLAKLYPGGEVKEKHLFDQIAESPVGQMAGGVSEAVHSFGQGLSDLSNGVDSEPARNAKDLLLTMPNVLWEDAKEFGKVLNQITQVLPPDIREKLPEEFKPTWEEGATALPRVFSNIVGMATGLKAEQIVAKTGAGLVQKAAAGGATYGGTYEALLARLEGASPEETAERTFTGTATGGAAGAILGKGFQELGKGVNAATQAIRDNIAKWSGKAVDEATPLTDQLRKEAWAERFGQRADAIEPSPRDIPTPEAPTAKSPAMAEAVPVAREPALEATSAAAGGAVPEPNAHLGPLGQPAQPGIMLGGQFAPEPGVRTLPEGAARSIVEPTALATGPGTPEPRALDISLGQPAPPSSGPYNPMAPRHSLGPLPAGELTGRLEQPRPQGTTVVEPTALGPGPAPAPLTALTEGRLPGNTPVPGLEPPIQHATRTPVAPNAVQNIIAAHDASGGSTVSLRTGESLAGTPSIAVAIAPDRTVVIEGKTVTPEVLEKFIQDNQDLLSDPRLSVGTWFDESSGKTYIDVSATFPKAQQAEAVALGKQLNQKAVTDLETLTDIPTGGTGEVLPRGLAPEPRVLTPGVAASSPAEKAAAAAVPSTPPAPGRWREYVTLADENIAAAKTRLAQSRQAKVDAGLLTGEGTAADLLKGEGGYLDPADVRDMSIIVSNYMLKGVATAAEVTEALVREFGETIRPFAARLYEEGRSMYMLRRPLGNDAIRSVASDYADGIGLRTVAMPVEYKRMDPAWGRKVANAFDELPASDPEAANSYNKFKQEVREQFEAAKKAGYTFVFETADKYAGDSAAMRMDLKDAKTLHVFKTPEDFGHPFLTPEENDMFRAIHDLFGHGREGYSFGPDGEYNAWRAHAQMFSNKAIPALSSETVGQNSWVNFGKHVKPGTPPSERPFAQQKAALLPKWVYEDLLHEGPKPKLAAGRTMVKETSKTVPVANVAKKLVKGVRPVETMEGGRARAEADLMTNVKAHLAENPKAATWYHDDVAQFRQNVQQEFPQTKDPGRMAWFILETAITSPGKKVMQNYAVASTMEDAFNRTGRLPLLARMGQEIGRNREPLMKANALLKKFEGDTGAVAEYLLTRDDKGEYRAVSEFGPKVGRFWLNLMGVHDEVTVDVWMTRWWKRLTGKPFDKKGEIIDAPETDKEAEVIRQTIMDMSREFGIDPDALQAVIWDREKKLWRSMGMRDSDDVAFALASEHVAGTRAGQHAQGLKDLAGPAQGGLFTTRSGLPPGAKSEPVNIARDIITRATKIIDQPTSAGQGLAKVRINAAEVRDLAKEYLKLDKDSSMAMLAQDLLEGVGEKNAPRNDNMRVVATSARELAEAYLRQIETPTRPKISNPYGAIDHDIASRIEKAMRKVVGIARKGESLALEDDQAAILISLNGDISKPHSNRGHAQVIEMIEGELDDATMKAIRDRPYKGQDSFLHSGGLMRVNGDSGNSISVELMSQPTINQRAALARLMDQNGKTNVHWDLGQPGGSGTPRASGRGSRSEFLRALDAFFGRLE